MELFATFGGFGFQQMPFILLFLLLATGILLILFGSLASPDTIAKFLSKYPPL
jgi:hypothetical protein